MVVFADEGMLDTADRLPRPNAHNDQRFVWRRLAGYPETIQAACGSAEAIEQLLDDWAQGLLRRFDAMYHLGRDRGYLKRIADFVLRRPIANASLESLPAIRVGSGCRSGATNV